MDDIMNTRIKLGRFRLFLSEMAIILLSLASITDGKEIFQQIPAKPDTNRHYIFYLHGRIIEEQGIRPTHNRFGVYEYEKILQSFADSCQPYMESLQSKGLKKYKEIELNLGLEHGFLYKPYREWVVPAVDWARH